MLIIKVWNTQESIIPDDMWVETIPTLVTDESVKYLAGQLWQKGNYKVSVEYDEGMYSLITD